MPTKNLYKESFHFMFHYKEISIFLLVIIFSKTKNNPNLFIYFIVSFLYYFLRRKCFRTFPKGGKEIKVKQDNNNKLFILTRSNTMMNKELLGKQKDYLDNIKNEYNLIYGEKGKKYFESILKDTKKPKLHKKVSFSGEIQYSN